VGSISMMTGTGGNHLYRLDELILIGWQLVFVELPPANCAASHNSSPKGMRISTTAVSRSIWQRRGRGDRPRVRQVGGGLLGAASCKPLQL
jgi:hypothetical protein